jgi:CysZ protein
MKALQLHINAISFMFIELGKGKYLLFFLPGIIISLIFWQIFLLTETVGNSFSFLEHIPLIGNYLKTGISGTIGFFQFLLDQLFIFSILTVLSPFNTILSDKVDSSITGKNYNFNFYQLISDLFRMILVVLLAFILEIFMLSIYWIFSVILNLGFLDPIAYFLIAGFFYGYSFYDYSLERHKKGILESLKFAFSNILIVVLGGSLFLLIYKIPSIGVIIAPVITTMITTFVYIKKQGINLTSNSK